MYQLTHITVHVRMLLVCDMNSCQNIQFDKYVRLYELFYVLIFSSVHFRVLEDFMNQNLPIDTKKSNRKILNAFFFSKLWQLCLMMSID